MSHIPHPEVSHSEFWEFGEIGLAIALPRKLSDPPQDFACRMLVICGMAKGRGHRADFGVSAQSNEGRREKIEGLRFQYLATESDRRGIFVHRQDIGGQFISYRT